MLTLGALFLAGYVTIALLRIRYPYELEWTEGCSVDHLARVYHGQPLYVRPSLEFTPYIYTPLYFHVSAWMARLTGIGFVPLRLVSLLASLACFAFIYLLVWRETARHITGFIAAALFAATYYLTSTWFDMGRVDSLALCLLLGALFFLRTARGVSGYLLAGVLAVLAYFTKQTMLICIIPLLFYYGCWHRRPLVVLLPTLGLGLLLGIGYLSLTTHGWFTLYCLVLPQQHPIVPLKFLSFWFWDILPRLTIAALGALALFRGRYRGELDQRRWFGCMAAGMLAGSWVARLHSGGYINVLMPAYAALAILLGLAIARVLPVAQDRQYGRAARRLLWLCPLQFLLLLYNPAACFPTPADRAAGDAFVRLLARYPGEVYVPYHCYMQTLAGKQSYAHVTNVFDILRAHQPRLQLALNAEIDQAIRAQCFSVIILDQNGYACRSIHDSYRYAGKVFADPDVFFPAAGLPYRPEYIYVPTVTKPLPTAARGSR